MKAYRHEPSEHWPTAQGLLEAAALVFVLGAVGLLVYLVGF